MSVVINVVGQTAVSVSVASQSAASVSVAASTGASVVASGGIGPAGFLTVPGTSTLAFGTFQLAAGEGITVSTANGQFLISSYPGTTVSSLAPVQSVAGRVGAVQLQASDVTAGTFAISRIPTIGYTALSGVPTAFMPASHTHDASDVASGTLSIARIPTISYTALANAPSTFSPAAHTHSTADITGITASFAAASHTHDAAAIASGVINVARLPASVSALNTLTGGITIAAGANVTVSTASSTITIAAGGGGGGSYELPTASSSVLGGIKVGANLTITDGVLAATGGGGGGSANIVEAATAAGFPATGASQTLYVSRDASRVYRWDSSGVYIELGN